MGQNFTRFEADFECAKKNVPANCTIGWAPTGSPSFGGTEHGQFESNGDIAGIGVLLSFAIPTGLMLLIGGIMWIGMAWHMHETKTASHNVKPIMKKASPFVPSPHGNRRRQGHPRNDPEARKPPSEKAYDIIESILLAFSDYQIVFAAALCLHFHFMGKCNLSMYHFNIGLNLITIALVSTLVSLVFLRNFWKTPFSSLARLTIFAFLLLFQAKMFWTLANRADTQGTVESRPPKQRTNSLFLLPAFCFLDPDPLTRLVKQVNEPTDQRSAREKLVGRLDPDQRWNAEINIWVVVTIIYGFLILYQIYGGLTVLCRGGRHRKPRNGGPKYQEIAAKPRSRFEMRIRVSVCLVTYLSCFAISIYRIVHVFHVREWVLSSGWMKDQNNLGNPETNFGSLGQVAPLVTMAGFLIVGLDKVTWQSGSRD